MAAITDLSTASSAASADYLVISQGGTDKKITYGNLAAFTVPVSIGGAGTGLTMAPRTGSGSFQWYNPTGADLRLYSTLDLLTIGYTGAIDLRGANSALTFYPRTSTGPFTLYNANGTTLSIYNGSSDVVVITSAGQVKSATLAGTGNRAVYSDSAGGLTNSSSDATLKTDVSGIASDEALALVGWLEPVRYNWLDQERRGEQREIGLIAQQVQPFVPEVIGTNEDGTLSLDYPKLTALLIGAVQELAARVAALEAAQAKA